MALLDIRNLCIEVPTVNGYVKILDNVNLTLSEQEVCGLVGESGSGKSLIAKVICNEAHKNWKIRADRFRFNDVELLKLTPSKRRKIVGQSISMVSQESLTAFDPTKKIGVQLKESIPGWTFKGKWWQWFGWRRRRVIELLHRVGIQDHKDIMHSYPHEITEGERQKVMVALAVANQPRLLVADEPTRSLESITTVQIFRLLISMNKNQGTTILLVSNDINGIKEYCDTFSILYCGQNIESGPKENLLKNPYHPYTKALLYSMPDFSQPIPPKSYLGTLKGSVPMLTQLPLGCRLGARCPFSQKQCIVKPRPRRIKQQVYSCHFPLNLHQSQKQNMNIATGPLVVSEVE